MTQKPKFAGPRHDVLLEPTGRFGVHGEIYRVVTPAGFELASGRSPEHAACRMMRDLGWTGDAYFSRPGKASWDFRMQIAPAADYSLGETDRGFAMRRWRPFDAVERQDT